MPGQPPAEWFNFKTAIMKKSLFLSTGFALLMLAFNACHKETSLQPQLINATVFENEHVAQLQLFTGNATAGFSITGAGGTEITFPAAAFVNANGDVVTGDVEIGIIEILTKKDLLLAGVPTESNGQLLESGGEIYIQAIQQGDTLLLNPVNGQWSTNPVQVKLPRDPAINPNGMILFNQGPRFDGNVLSDDSFTWLVFDESPQSMVGPYAYDFTIPAFGWINVDKFLNYPPSQLTFVHVQLTPGSTNGLQDVAVLMVFEDINAVIGLNYDPAMNRFGTESFSVTPNIPIGEQIAVVMIAKDAQHNLYFSKQENITVVANATYTMTPQLATQQDINWLNNL